MTKLEKSEIKGRTDMGEWCMKLVQRWRKEHNDFEEWVLTQPDPESHLSLADDFANKLEQHIMEFANT